MMKRFMPKSPSHTLLAFCFWCIHLLCLVERCKVQARTNFTDPDEERALNAIFQYWGLYDTSGDWNISGDPCTGTAVDLSRISDLGIKCDCPSNGGGTCHVTEMTVSDAGIEGSLPSFIGKFRRLRYLDISYNNFNGSLPPEIGTLPSLEHLHIMSAGFNGMLPPELGSLSRLQQLDISYNDFNGLLPPELGNLSSLQELDISSNGFNGLLPPELGNLSSLQKLDMSSSGLGGEIPSTFANLRNMKILSASGSQLTKIPNFIGNWNLTNLDVSENYMTGPLPASIGNLTNLTSLNIGSNNFTGSLPPELGNLTSLQKLYIDSCGLSGQIPSTFVHLRKVNTLWASDNNFTGKIPDFIGSWALTYLSMQGNAFEGPIPSSFSNLTSLNYLWLSDVSNGSPSYFIENMTSLYILVLRNNSLSGTIPSTIEKHQALRQMDLSFNNLSGTIPVSLFNMSSLVYLFLGNNSLSGRMPSQKRKTLRNIDLSYNQLSGSFPSWVTEQGLNLNLVANNFTFDGSNNSDLPLSLNCLQRSSSCYRNSQYQSSFAIRCGGPSMKINDTEYEGDNDPLGPAYYMEASTGKWAVSNVGIFSRSSNREDNIYEGISINYNWQTDQGVFPNTADSELFQLARISPGSLRYYGLGLENGNYTVNLKFAVTDFPDSKTGKSVGRRVFDIYLQGNLAWKDFDIKKEAGIAFKAGIEKKQWVMVHEHVLEIHLLWAGKGTCCIPSPGTYGPAISAILVTPNFKPTVRPRRKKNKIALAVEILASVVLSIVSVSVFLIWKRNKRLSVGEDEEFLGMGPKANTFRYGELKTATKDFSPANKLGQGGFGPVFKGTLLDGQTVAVKQLSVASHQGKSQLVAEIATISAVQHRNLVKLHGCCIEGANQLLVYEYLENKSLDQALFGNSNLHLDWHTRFKICLGTARGLAYLHEESRPRIVHRDIKASNILLDVDLNPKISDFGLAKLYDDKMTHMSTRVAGTIGYLAPEYAMRGHLTEKADVFGFGVLTLEIVSGRPNTCQNVDLEKMYLLEWAWHLHENNRPLELVDPKLSNFDEGEAARMISIALLCIQALPSLRPPMSRVVNMLLGEIEVGAVSSKPSYLTGLPSDDTGSFMASVTITSQQFSSWYESSSSLSATKPMLHEDIGDGR
ncbi:probable LRR receptor-like serine/threonine-protein kinase At1g56140 isoform X3 [Magnolia sinica]|uniref:probable LRR receptor-like serine/threonine-protein kinase At1g56140 isoform X3 n=1 Tax=Magnolia sinica TaxID=86752 RepID=UPI00265A0051|nr:probable LRR receptor-like serine/threonine-protein kinase At1g56140 isoform X3 [Magnolia sinica]